MKSKRSETKTTNGDSSLIFPLPHFNLLLSQLFCFFCTTLQCKLLALPKGTLTLEIPTRQKLLRSMFQWILFCRIIFRPYYYYYLADASLVISPSEVTTRYNLKHRPARMLQARLNVLLFFSRRTITTYITSLQARMPTRIKKLPPPTL